MTERQAVSTSQPSPGDVTALWDKVLAEYEELVYIPMSSGLSASCATAQMLAEDYEGRVFVVDNHRISISQKSSVWDAVALREAGYGAQEIQRELEASGLDSIAVSYTHLDVYKRQDQKNRNGHLEDERAWLLPTMKQNSFTRRC